MKVLIRTAYYTLLYYTAAIERPGDVFISTEDIFLLIILLNARVVPTLNQAGCMGDIFG